MNKENPDNQYKNNLIANLNIPLGNTEVLTTESKELELVNSYFSSIACNNAEVETLLYEVIGYSISMTSKFSKAFIFKGDGRNGKSKIFRILESLLGEDQTSHEHLENLSGSKAGAKSTVKLLENCTVNIAEDQKQPKYINTSLITRLISGETISIVQKNNEKFDLKPFATLLFSVNELIDFKETGLYITDRFIVIPFNAVFTDANNTRNVNIGEELCKPIALQIIATRAIQAFNQVLIRGKFTIPLIVEEETKKYFLECNNVEEFINLYPIKHIMTKSKYYTEYSKWCSMNNKEAVSNAIFGKRLLALGYRAERYSFGNKRYTYYTSVNFNNEDSRGIYNKYLCKYGLCEETDKTSTEAKIIKDYTDDFSNYLWKNSLEK